MNKWANAIEKAIPDAYDRKARLYPMLLLLFPVLLSFWAIVPEKMYNWEAIAGLAFWCGVAYFLKEMGRNSGKKKEGQLWENWGGAPTIQYLRHQGETNKVTLDKIHKNLQVIIPDLTMPTFDQEVASSEEADEIYEECTRIMIQKTRNHKKYPLLFNELCSYGFWRNLWGLKPWGILLATPCFIIVALSILSNWHNGKDLVSYNPIICETLNLFIIFFWITLNDNKIKVPAFAYALRLFEATEAIVTENKYATKNIS